MNGVAQFFQTRLQQAQAQLAHFEDALAQHVKTDFLQVKAELETLITHCKEEVAALEAKVQAHL